jgi:nitrate/nitrite transporter NarK
MLFVAATRNMSNERVLSMRKQVNIQRNVVTTVSSPGPLLLALCFLCYAGQWMALMNFLPTFFIEALNSDKGSAAIFTALAVVSNIPGNIAGGWLCQKNIPRWMLLSFAFIVTALTTFGIYSFGTMPSVRLMLLLLFSFVGGIIPGTLLASVPFHAPAKDCLATTNGFITQGSNLGTLIIPPVLAVVVSVTGGWDGAPWLFAAAGSVGLLSSLGIRRLEAKPKP